MRPYQRPHPPMRIPGAVAGDRAMGRRTRFPYVMLATRMEPTKLSFDYYDECAREAGYEAGTQHRGYLFKVHVDETEELAYETGKKFLTGPGNIFLEGSRGDTRKYIQDLPGMTDRKNLLPTGGVRHVAESRGQEVEPPQRDPNFKPLVLDSATKHVDVDENYRELLEAQSIISGTPKQVIPKIRQVLEYLRPGSVFLWDGDGPMTDDDALRSLARWARKLSGPCARWRELDLKSPLTSKRARRRRR